MLRSINQNNIKFYLDAQQRLQQDNEYGKSKDIRLLNLKKALGPLKDHDFEFILTTVEKLIECLIKNQSKEITEKPNKKRQTSLSAEQHLLYLNKDPEVQSSRSVKETAPI